MEFYNDVGSDPFRPSLFELVAQEQLRDLLQPALKYVLSVLAQRYPRYLLRVVNRHEEFYALLMLFVERHYLRKYSATFAENFYGLKRRRKPLYETERAHTAAGIPPGEGKLRSRELRLSLLFTVAVPYLRAKLQDYYESLGGGLDPEMLEGRRQTNHQDNTWKIRLREGFKRAYPYMNLGFEIWLACYNVAYLFDRTPYYRPWLSWMGVDLRRLGPNDISIIKPSTEPQTQSPQSLLPWIRYMMLRSPHLLLESLKVLLPTAIFFVKFLEWWYSPSSPARTMSTSEAGPPIPPPALLKPHPQGILFDPTKYGICPLCSEPIANATALPSGYVFCYRCVHSHVEENGKCPVTLTAAATWQLRKILI